MPLMFLPVALPSKAVTTVALDGDTVVTTARPLQGRTVQSIAIQRASEKKHRAPRRDSE